MNVGIIDNNRFAPFGEQLSPVAKNSRLTNSPWGYTGESHDMWAKSDLNYATEKANTLKPGERGYFDFPKGSDRSYICQMELLNQQHECGFEIMVRVHGMDIQCSSERGYNLSFYIQASNPKFQYVENFDDESLSDAIESAFPLNTENAILSWNYVSIPLSYKYDISYMMEDILKLLYDLQSKEDGKIVIHWLPDTFRSNWTLSWNNGKLEIQSQWECTVGHLERILNEKPNISLSINTFVSEWKEILCTVIDRKSVV